MLWIDFVVIENIKNAFSEIVDVVEQAVENIKNFDFTTLKVLQSSGH